MTSRLYHPLNKRIICGVALVCVMLFSLVGCRYNRLLKFKDDLRNFEITCNESFSDGYRLEFRHPILRQEDVTLLGFCPSRIKKLATGEIWLFDFNHTGKRTNVISVELVFNDDGLLILRIPPALADLLPRSLPRAFLKAIGYSRIDLRKRTLRIESFAEMQLRFLSLPRFPEMRRCLGEPTKTLEIDSEFYAISYLYYANNNCQGLSFEFTGTFRKYLHTMQLGTILFGPYTMTFSESALGIESIL